MNFSLFVVSLIVLTISSFKQSPLRAGGLRYSQYSADDTQVIRSNRFNNKMEMSSVSSERPQPTPPPRSAGFIISPTSQGSENELLILQNFNQIQYGEKKKFGVIGTQDLSSNHKQMVELLSYALILSGNHVYTSAGSINGTNLAVIQGSLRACNPDLLTVILPQGLFRQPPEIHPLLLRVANLIQQPQYDNLDLKEAAAMCNEQILSNVEKLLVFCYHDSTTILNPIEAVKDNIEIITFYLD